MAQDWGSMFGKASSGVAGGSPNETVAAQNMENLDGALDWFNAEYEGLLDDIEIRWADIDGLDGKACTKDKCFYLPNSLKKGTKNYSTSLLVDSIAHEYLHVYMNETYGVPIYMVSELTSAFPMLLANKVLGNDYIRGLNGVAHSAIYVRAKQVQNYYNKTQEVKTYNVPTKPVIPRL